MEDQLISFETAKLAKEKGFDLKVFHYVNALNNHATCSVETTYYPDGDGIDNVGGAIELNYNSTKISWDYETWGRYYDDNGIFEYYSAPTQSLLQRWIREAHGINVQPSTDITLNWICLVQSLHPQASYTGDSKLFGGDGRSYEEVLEEGLKEALSLLEHSVNGVTT